MQLNSKAFSIFLLLSSASSLCAAQTSAPGNAEDPSNVRVQYDRDPALPDEVAFADTLRVVRVMHERDPKMSVAWVASNMGLEQQAADQFVSLLVGESERLDSLVRDATRELACDQGIPRATGDAVFSVFGAMDDTRRRVASTRLLEFKKSLSTDHAARFQQWLEKRKTQIVHIEFDYRPQYEQAGRSADARIAGICNKLAHESRGPLK